MTVSNTSSSVAVGVFDGREKAEAAIDELVSAGFAAHDIGVAARDARGEWKEFRSVDADSEGAETGMVAGAATGAGIGGLWALGIAAGMLPALGPAVAGGLLGSLLASAAGGAAAGGLVGTLVGFGVSEEDARAYETELHNGRVVVTVRVGTRFVEAMRILEMHGAHEVRVTAANAM